MGASTRTNKSAYFHKKYKNDPEACADVSTGDFRWEYKGSGVTVKDHPLCEDMWMEQRTCGNCGSKDLLVIYAQRNINPMNGDEYFDFEVVCQQCRHFTIYSYADND